MYQAACLQDRVTNLLKVLFRTPSAQISSFYESRFESGDADRLTPPHLLEQTQFANQFEIDF